MIRLLKILYIKWIKGECRELCRKCEFKNQCFDNFETEVKKNKYYKVSDGIFTYYINIDNGEKKTELDTKDKLVDIKLSDLIR